MKKIYGIDTDYYEIQCEFKHITNKAVLVNDGDKDVWLPLSQLQMFELNDGIVTALIPEWIAIEKELV